MYRFCGFQSSASVYLRSHRSSRRQYSQCSILRFSADSQTDAQLLKGRGLAEQPPNGSLRVSSSTPTPTQLNMMFTRPFATLLAAATYATTAYAWFRLPCTTPLVSERVDPIISPGQPSFVVVRFASERAYYRCHPVSARTHHPRRLGLQPELHIQRFACVQMLRLRGHAGHE
jgi:hypothetical protein